MNVGVARRGWAWASVPIVTALLTTRASPALAEPPSDVAGEADRSAEVPKAKAQRLLQEGFAFLDEGNMASALDRFRAAYDAFPRANLLLNIGSTLRQVGRNADAAAAYRRYLAEAGEAGARRAHVERTLREITLVLGRIRVQVGGAHVTLLVDGAPVAGGAVRSIEVDAGKHTIVATVMGRPRAVQTVEVAAGRETSLALDVTQDISPRLVIVKEGLPALQVAGVVMTAMGLVAIGVGSGFGLAAMGDERALEGHCSVGLGVCDPAAEKLADSATFKARVATGAFVAGGGVALVGAALLVFGRRPRQASASVGSTSPRVTVAPGALWLGVGGTW